MNLCRILLMQRGQHTKFKKTVVTTITFQTKKIETTDPATNNDNMAVFPNRVCIAFLGKLEFIKWWWLK